jgi:prevent-host-death family protein
MKTATVTEAKNGLSALLDQVKAGHSVLITERGVPIARIEPMTRAEDPDGRLERLERAGMLRRGKGPIPLELILTPPPPVHDGADVVELLLEERRSGW